MVLRELSCDVLPYDVTPGANAHLGTTSTCTLMRSNAHYCGLKGIFLHLLNCMRMSRMLRSVLSFVLLLSFGADFSCVAAAENQSNAETCPEVSLVSGCSTHDNCTTVACALNFTAQSLSLRVDIFRCAGMVATTTIVNIPDESSSYWDMFDGTGVKTVPVPGFPYVQWKGYTNVSVQLRLTLTDYCGLFWVKVELLAGGELIEGGSRFPVRNTVMYALFAKADCSGEFQDYACDSVPTDNPLLPPESILPPQLLQILFPGLMVALLITSICCCYHWCRRRCSAAATEETVSGGPAVTLRNLVTMRIPDIPMQQLVNETEGSAKV